MNPQQRPPIVLMLLTCALSLSIGWGIRGNFGHEYGAMIPGALAAIAAALFSGRADWQQRVAYFGMFGGLGWSFGGSISYMQVIAYTHSGHGPSQFYGFACLFVIGFAWGALGGAGTALPAVLDRQRLTSLFPPLLAVFAAWWLQDLLVPILAPVKSGDQRHEHILYWYDTDWLGVLVAIVAVLALALVRRTCCWGSRLILHMAVGWWLGFLIVVFIVDVLGFEFRMTPPRGDNWAGVLGAVFAALIFFVRHDLTAVARATLTAGTWGGFGFAAATMLKLIEFRYVPLALSSVFGESAWQTNWHSVLEQTYGFINGIGIAVVMADLARWQPIVKDEPRNRRGTEVLAVAFVILLIPYVNIVKNVPKLIQHQAIPAQMYGLPSRWWFDAGFAILTVAVLFLLVRHLHKPLAMIPTNPLGKGQLLYLALLWTMIVGNVMRAIPPFHEQRLITEGVVYFNAVLCTMLVLLGPRPLDWPQLPAQKRVTVSLVDLTGLGLLVLVFCAFGFTGLTRAIHGGAHVKHARYQTRFGPDAKTGKPVAGQPHP